MIKFEIPKEKIETISEQYTNACNRPTDINLHLPTLYNLASQCKTVTEFGVRTGESTLAFLHAAIEHSVGVSSYDIEFNWVAANKFQQAKKEGAITEYIIGSTLNIEIAPTDLLFIDTHHTYEQLTCELDRHSHKVVKYIAIHDTTSYVRLSDAVIDFMIRENKYVNRWAFHSHYTNNNGLTVLERRNV